MKFELSTEQVNQLLNIIANASIKGADANAILQLVQALQRPVVEEVKKEDKPKGK